MKLSVKTLECFYNYNFDKFAQLARGLEVQTNVVRAYGLRVILHASVRLYIYICLYDFAWLCKTI